jgi:tripartite-type tricarboxylate transporter receptor subunit TctC
MTELGYPQATVSNWLGLIAPKGTPRPIVMKLNEAYNKALEMPELREKIVGPGNEIGGGTPEAFAEFIAAEAARWQRLSATAGIKVE